MRGDAAPENIVDQDIIDELRNHQRNGKPDILAKVIEILLSDAPNQIEAVREAAARDDAKTLDHEAHALRANCLSLGLQRMSRVCSELTELGRSGRLEVVPALLAQLETEYDYARTALLAVLSPRGD